MRRRINCGFDAGSDRRVEGSTTRRRKFLFNSLLGLSAALTGAAAPQAEAASSDLDYLGKADAIKFPDVPAGKVGAAVSADGTKIALNEYGKSTGRPILFIHGFSQSRLCWHRQITDEMLTSSFRMITVDLRGHGDSDKPTAPYTAANFADDIHAAVTTFDLVKPVLVGWSLGGLVVLDYLAKYGIESVSKVMFVDAGIGRSSRAGESSPWGKGFTENVPMMLSNDAAVNVRGTLSFLKACTAAALPISDLAFALAYNMLTPPACRRAVPAGRITPEDYDLTVMPALKAAKIPVLCVTGDQDQIVLPYVAKIIAQSTGGDFLAYPGVGHMPFLEISARFNDDLAKFAN